MEESKPTLKCKKCYGRGFYIKANGYTSADRVHCNKCNGLGLVYFYKDRKYRTKEYINRYSKQGVEE